MLPRWVEPIGWLIEDQEIPLAEQRSGDPKPLLHTKRVVAKLGVGALDEANGAERVVDQRRVVKAGDASHEPQIHPSAEIGIEGRPFDEGPDVPQGRRQVGLDIVAEDLRGARVDLHEAEQHADRRRLPGPIGPEKAKNRARRNGEGQVVDRDEGAEAFGQSLELNRGRCGVGSDHGLPLTGIGPRPPRRQRGVSPGIHQLYCSVKR